MLYNLPMRFEWTFWDFAKEYLVRVTGLWLAVLSAFSLIVELIAKFWLGKDIPNEYWILLLVVGTFITQSVAYYGVARRQIPGERIENGLRGISDLRADGVNRLQNVDTGSIRTAEDLKKFQDQFLEWRNRVVTEIEKVSSSQASIFRVLGLVKYDVALSGYQGAVKEELEKTLREIVDYGERIREFVDRFSVENLANRVRK